MKKTMRLFSLLLTDKAPQRCHSAAGEESPVFSIISFKQITLKKRSFGFAASECSMLNVKYKNFHQLVFYSLIHRMPALITYVLQLLMLTF